MFSSKTLGVCCVAVVAAAFSTKQASAQCGKASWYHEGSRTATGERYRPDGITAAHKTLPFGTVVQVQHQRTGRTVNVRINDRGPFIRGRIIDLSRGAKRVLGMDGVAPVCITVLGRGGKFADAGPSLFGSSDSVEQPRGHRHGRSHARVASADSDLAQSRRHSHRHRIAQAELSSGDFDADETGSSGRGRSHARLASADSDFAEPQRHSRRHRAAQAESGSDDFDTSETRSRRHRRHTHVHSRARSRHASGYRRTLAGWPGAGSEM